jgi:hypothetical protein
MDLNRLCTNDTPMVVEPFLLDDRHGHELAVVVAKVSWLVSARGEPRLAIPPRPVRLLDERGPEARLGAFDLPSDRVEQKPGTDVILLGSAYPSEPGATEQVVSLRLETGSGSIQKAVRVFGARMFAQGLLGVVPGPARALAVTPLVYELARGGLDRSGVPDRKWRNPVGIGLTAEPERQLGQPAYVIEPEGGAPPAGFGPIDPSWSPRRELAGTYDAQWARERAPVRPEDFDPRHHVACHPDLWSERPLAGDEPVEVLGASPEGAWRFRLPRYAPRFECIVAGTTTALDTHLDTFLIDLTDPEWRVVELCWRAAVRLPRKTERLESIAILPDAALPGEIYDRLGEDLARHRAAGEPGRTPGERR